MELVINGIKLGLLIIALLEVCRYFRRVGRSFRDIDALKKRVEELEEIIKNQNNK